MGRSPYPPPPPPPPPPSTGVSPNEFHLPRTNFFSTIRNRLVALEKPMQFTQEINLKMGFLVAIVLTALVGVLVALAISMAIMPAFGQSLWLLLVIFAPILEEIVKSICIIIVVIFIVKTLPNRRYGAALGAAAGFGFGIFESVIFILSGQAKGMDAVVRLIVTPLMHPLWSAIVGIGVFVFTAQRKTTRSFFEAIMGLPFLFLVIGMINHAMWNAFAVLIPSAGGLWATPHLATVLDIIIVFPLFAFLLRDLLGGHFNFQRFFETIPEPSPFYPKFAPPPPPVPGVPACPTCGQPLAYIPEYNKWYCTREKKYV